MKLYQDKEWLEQKYVEERLVGREMAVLAGCSDVTIGNWLRRHGISVQPLVKKGIYKECEACGVEFYVEPRQVRSRRFCSEACAKAKMVKDAHPGWRGGDIEVVCRICGTKFRVNQARVGSAKFCSRECHHIGQSNSVEKVCESCGKKFKIPPCRDEQECGKFCSWECRTTGMVGSRAPNWRGGISFEPYPVTFNKKFKQMIRERDNHTCLICGYFGNCVHHISYVKDDTEPDNCVTLCRSCHGRTSFQRDYWPSFLKSLTGKRVMLDSLVI